MVEPVLDVEDAGVVQDVEGGVVRRHSLVKGECRGESVVTGRRAEGVSSPMPAHVLIIRGHEVSSPSQPRTQKYEKRAEDAENIPNADVAGVWSRDTPHR